MWISLFGSTAACCVGKMPSCAMLFYYYYLFLKTSFYFVNVQLDKTFVLGIEVFVTTLRCEKSGLYRSPIWTFCLFCIFSVQSVVPFVNSSCGQLEVYYQP